MEDEDVLDRSRRHSFLLMSVEDQPPSEETNELARRQSSSLSAQEANEGNEQPPPEGGEQPPTDGSELPPPDDSLLPPPEDNVLPPPDESELLPQDFDMPPQESDLQAPGESETLLQEEGGGLISDEEGILIAEDSGMHEGSGIHKSGGSELHTSEGSGMHMGGGSGTHMGGGSGTHMGGGSGIHMTEGSGIHPSGGSGIHMTEGSGIHPSGGSGIHMTEGSGIHPSGGSGMHTSDGSELHMGGGSGTHMGGGSGTHMGGGSGTHMGGQSGTHMGGHSGTHMSEGSATHVSEGSLIPEGSGLTIAEGTGIHVREGSGIHINEESGILIPEVRVNPEDELDMTRTPALKKLADLMGEPPKGLEAAILPPDQNAHVAQKTVVRGSSEDFADYITPSRLSHTEGEEADAEDSEPDLKARLKGISKESLKLGLSTERDSLMFDKKGRKNSAGDYESPELMLRKLQKANVNKAKNQSPSKYTEIMEELTRLNRLLKDDERRLFEESLWGKEAMHEIMKLDELKTILEKQVEAGGDGTIAQKQLNMFQMELDDRQQLLMKMMTLYHQCESELQAVQQEAFYLKEHINNLLTKRELADDLNKDTLDELKRKSEMIVCIRTELQQTRCILDQARIQNEQLRMKIKQLMEGIKKLTTEKKDLEMGIDMERLASDQAEQTYKKILEELVQKCNVLMSMEVEVAQAKSVLHKVESRRNDLKKNIEEVSEEIGSMSSAQETIEETIEREKATLAAEKSNASQIKQLHDREVQKVDALKLDRDMLLKNISEERSLSEKLREELDHEENLVEDQVGKLTFTQQEIDRQLEEISMLEERTELLDKDKSHIIKEYNDLCEQLEDKDQFLKDIQESYELKIDSMKNVVMLQQTGREQVIKTYKTAILGAREEIKSLNEVLKHKELQLQSYSRALQELQEIFMYSFFKSTSIN